MPYINELKCNKCDFESWGLETVSFYYYEFKKSNYKYYAKMNRKKGWCYECNQFRAIEHFTTIDEEVNNKKKLYKRIESNYDLYISDNFTEIKYNNKKITVRESIDKLSFFQDKLKNIRSSFLSFLPKNKREIKLLKSIIREGKDSIQTIEKEYNNQLIGIDLLIEQIKKRNRNPKCLECSSENIVYVNTKYDNGNNEIDFKHPSCGGDFYYENKEKGKRIHALPSFDCNIYDIEGNLILKYQNVGISSKLPFVVDDSKWKTID